MGTALIPGRCFLPVGRIHGLLKIASGLAGGSTRGNETRLELATSARRFGSNGGDAEGRYKLLQCAMLSVPMGLGDQVARKTTSGRRDRTQPRFFYKGDRKQVKLRVSDALHKKLQGSKASGVTQLERWDEALRWYLQYYKKNPGASIEAATRGGVDPERIYWIDVDLYAALKVIADQRNVPVARVIHTAGMRFVAESL